MTRMKILIFLSFALMVYCSDYNAIRFRRSSIKEAACKRKPFLAFCRDESSFGRRTGSARPSPARPAPSRPKPQPFPFGTERFGSTGGRFGGGDFERSDRLEGGNSNWRKITGTNRPTSVSESLGLGGGGSSGAGNGGVGVSSGLGIGVPGVGPIGVNSGIGVGAPGIGGNRGGGLGGLGLGNGGLFGISSGVGVSSPIGPIGISSGLGVG